MSKLWSSLSKWKKNLGTSKMPTKLAFLLEHQYTDASLRYDGLKGHDHQVAAHLREACQELGFCFYLANFERRIYGGCDEDGGGYGDWDDSDGAAGDFHEITEECDRSTSLEKVVDLDGTEIDKDLNFDEEYFIQENPFENKAPDAEDYSGFTGNEGVSATHFYHRTVSPLYSRTYLWKLIFSRLLSLSREATAWNSSSLVPKKGEGPTCPGAPETKRRKKKSFSGSIA
jgi:hypothetical protein